jgi:acetyltransferase-like isoleucine patch superfamily enzyme
MNNSINFKNSEIVDVICGSNLTIVKPSNIYECKFGNDVFVGPFVEIQRNVVIGNRVRIQSHSFICEFVTIGDDSVVAHGVMFINDPFTTNGSARGDRTKWRSTKIGQRVAIGSNATILPVTIADDVTIGAGTVVTKDITEAGIYAGNPARRLRGNQ